MMDREDGLYLGGAAFVSVGAGIAWLPAGLICLGMFLVFPALLSMLRTKGPSK